MSFIPLQVKDRDYEHSSKAYGSKENSQYGAHASGYHGNNAHNSAHHGSNYHGKHYGDNKHGYSNHVHDSRH